jgi:3',5'-cyclic AMP phosphodiesterase CpdA
MRILHISDLHLNPNYHKINIDKTRLAFSEALKKGFDHLIITGDVAHDADKESFLIFKNILKEFSLLDSPKTTIVIGNHDIFGGVYSVKDLINFPERCKFTNFEQKVMEFVNYFEELFVDCIFPSEENIFPFAKIIGDFVFIGINTNDVYSVLKNPFASNGKITDKDFENLKLLLKNSKLDGKKKIILSHHHFYKNNYEAKSSGNDLWNKIEGYTLKLRGKKKLIKQFVKNDVKIVLHGHSHENKHYKRSGIDFYNSGGSIDNDEPKVYLNFIDVENSNINIEQNELLLRAEENIVVMETM